MNDPEFLTVFENMKAVAERRNDVWTRTIEAEKGNR
jgi:hypothetical protein